eukprot:9485389-Pyramimonas_sp.AAC.1
MGLLHDDVEASAALEEACRITTSLAKLCELFAQLLVWMDVQDKTAYWAMFKAALREHHRDTNDAVVYNLVDEQLG